MGPGTRRPGTGDQGPGTGNGEQVKCGNRSAGLITEVVTWNSAVMNDSRNVVNAELAYLRRK